MKYDPFNFDPYGDGETGPDLSLVSWCLLFAVIIVVLAAVSLHDAWRWLTDFGHVPTLEE